MLKYKMVKRVVVSCICLISLLGVVTLLRAQCQDCGSGEQRAGVSGCAYSCPGVPQCVGASEGDVCSWCNPPSLITITCSPAPGSRPPCNGVSITEQFNQCYTWFFNIPCSG